MHSTPPSVDTSKECQRLKQLVDRDGGIQNLSQTDLAFLETFCHFEDDPLPAVQNANLSADSGIDESAHIRESTSFGDPNAGRPDDPDDANPAAPDPAITRQ